MSALAGKLRDQTGKSATSKVRSDGGMPAVMYGLKDHLNVIVNTKELQKLINENGLNTLIELNIEGDTNRNVVVKEFQTHPLKTGWVHADFLEVDINKKIKAKVPVFLVGVCPGEKQGGVINHILRNVEVESLPIDIPEKIDLSMVDVQLGQALHISDLVVPENVTKVNSPDDLVVTVYTAKVKEEKEEVEGEESGADVSAEAAVKKEDTK
jgi:large subunit ribosomal protein L25